MPQYVAPHPDVEVLGLYVMPTAYGVKRGTEKRLELLAKHGVPAPEADQWYRVQNVLDAIKDIEEYFGEANLHAMGKAVALTQAIPQLPSLRVGFEFVNPSTLSNHRVNGVPLLDMATGAVNEPFAHAIGETRLLEYDEARRFAVIWRNSPYPVQNMIGWFTGFVERFTPFPEDKGKILVREDITKERQTQGGESSTILINW